VCGESRKHGSEGAVGNLLTIDSARRETPRGSARRWLPTLLNEGGVRTWLLQESLLTVSLNSSSR